MINLGLVKEGCAKYDFICNYVKENYRIRLGGELDFFPKTFIYAEEDDCVIGCVGLTSAIERNPLLTEIFFDFDVLDYISNGNLDDRRLFGEIGCLSIPKNVNRYLNVILTAGIIIIGHSLGYKYLVLMTTKVIQRMSKRLDIITTKVGNPDWSKHPEFVKEWNNYSKLKPDIISFDVEQALTGCYKNISQFEDVNYKDLLLRIL